GRAKCFVMPQHLGRRPKPRRPLPAHLLFRCGWNRQRVIPSLLMPGRSVRLFLIDGTPQGMRTAEVGNWTGLALVCPRTDLVRLGTRPEVRRTGAYILVGPSESSP